MPEKLDEKSILDPEVLANVSGLKFRVRKIVEGYITGLHKSPYHGFSVEFAQHRQYSPGDDIRYIDWKVFGKTDRYYIKEYEEETNMKVSILVDCSESMGYGSGGLTKYEYASCIAATLSYILLNQQDSVGVSLFSDKLEEAIPPSGDPGMLKHIVELLENKEPEGKTEIEQFFRKASAGLKRRGLLVVLSDLFTDSETIEKSLNIISSRGHSVFLFHILDSEELNFPFEDMTLFKGMENEGELLVNPNSIRKEYLKEIRDFVEKTKKNAIRNEINYYRLSTSEPLDVALSSILTTHGGRRKS